MLSSPLTKFEARRGRGPSVASSRSGNRRSASAIIIRTSSRAERGAEAEVSPDAERDVRVRAPTDVELVGVLEDVLVTVRRRVEEHELVALR